MRKFYILGLDAHSDEKTIVISRYEMGDFQLVLLWDGAEIEEIPNFVRLFANNCDVPIDYVGNPISWMVCIKSFADIISYIAADDVQVFNAPIICEDNGLPIEGYKIINPIKRIECMDPRYATRIVTNMVLLEEKIPIETNLFRVHENPYAVTISEKVVKSLNENQLKGYYIHPLKVV